MADGEREADLPDRWKKWQLSPAFDLIASEYGWTDEQCLNLTLARIRIAVSCISERHAERARFELKVAEMNATAIIAALPALAQSKAGGKSIQRYVKHLSFWREKPKERELPSTETLERMFRG